MCLEGVGLCSAQLARISRGGELPKETRDREPPRTLEEAWLCPPGSWGKQFELSRPTWRNTIRLGYLEASSQELACASPAWQPYRTPAVGSGCPVLGLPVQLRGSRVDGEGRPVSSGQPLLPPAGGTWALSQCSAQTRVTLGWFDHFGGAYW